MVVGTGINNPDWKEGQLAPDGSHPTVFSGCLFILYLTAIFEPYLHYNQNIYRKLILYTINYHGKHITYCLERYLSAGYEFGKSALQDIVETIRAEFQV